MKRVMAATILGLWLLAGAGGCCQRAPGHRVIPTAPACAADAAGRPPALQIAANGAGGHPG
jgi:hypothetical protein